MIEEIVRQVKFYIVRCDRCDLLCAEADQKEEAIFKAREQGFVMEPQWNGSAYCFTVFCPCCHATISRRTEPGL